MFRRLVIAVVAVATTLVAGPATTGHATTTVPAFPGKVYVFVGENTSLSQLTMKNAPYQLGTIKPDSAWFSDYWGISHYSTSNYIAMTSGTYTRCDQLDEKPKTCNHAFTNIFGMLEDKGTSWAAWNESMPEDCYLVNAGEDRYLNSYRVKHNPAVYYHDIVGNDFSQATGTDLSAPCQTKVIPMGGTGPNDTSDFEAAAIADDTPQFNFVVPNMCEDGHDNCNTSKGGAIKQFDDFLSREIAAVQESQSWRDGKDVIVVVYDEGQDGGTGKARKFAGGHTICAIMGAGVVNGDYPDFTNHYNLLRTLVDGFQLGTAPANASNADPMAIWGS
jgi:phosphatidylinositol-3-phosphatase